MDVFIEVSDVYKTLSPLLSKGLQILKKTNTQTNQNKQTKSFQTENFKLKYTNSLWELTGTKLQYISLYYGRVFKI